MDPQVWGPHGAASLGWAAASDGEAPRTPHKAWRKQALLLPQLSRGRGQAAGGHAARTQRGSLALVGCYQDVRTVEETAGVGRGGGGDGDSEEGRVAFSHRGPCCVGSAGGTGMLGMKGSPAPWSGPCTSGRAHREQEGPGPRVRAQRSLRPGRGPLSSTAR